VTRIKNNMQFVVVQEFPVPINRGLWTAIVTDVLIAIVKKRLNLDHSLHKTLQVPDLNICGTMPISTLLGKLQDGPVSSQDPFQPTLFPTLRNQ